MKFEITHPKVWKKVSEQNIPMKHKIKIYEKLGGAYRLGENEGEQVFNKMTELLKHKQNEETEKGSDYEVSMSQKQLDGIIKDATELKQKMGEQEFNVAAWVQDHISNAANYINQANTGFSKEEK
jgi:CYTH domain-containing protein